MFHNTINGEYLAQKNGLKTSYKFPENASILLGNTSIPLSGLTVECYGGTFDAITIQQFANTVSYVKAADTNIYNTDIFITSMQLRKNDYPSRKDFFLQGIEFMSLKDLDQLQKAMKSGFSISEFQEMHHEQIVKFIKKFNNDKITSFKKRIDDILNNQNQFPKNISIIYDDRDLKHTTHIILEFINSGQFNLIIQNTLSPLYTFIGPENIKKVAEHMDPLKCREIVNEDSLVLSGNGKVYKFNIIIDFFNDIYLNMIENLKKIGYEMLEIELKDLNNQKNTSECVILSMQNKLDYISAKKAEDNTESVNRKRIRTRAEMTVLLYLLTADKNILRHDDSDAKDRGVEYKSDDWYPNYANVCNELDKKLFNLSLPELEDLHSLYTMDSTKLAPVFKDKIKQIIMDKKSDFTSGPTIFAGNKISNEVITDANENKNFQDSNALSSRGAFCRGNS